MKVNVIFYSMYGHTYRLAEAVARGAREVPGADVGIFQVPELVSPIFWKNPAQKRPGMYFLISPFAKPADMVAADAVIFGSPSRFGNMCAQMRYYLDQTRRSLVSTCIRRQSG